MKICKMIVFMAYFQLLHCQEDKNSEEQIPQDDNEQQQSCQFQLDNYQKLEILDDETIIVQISDIFSRDEPQYQYSSRQLDFNLETELVSQINYEYINLKSIELYKTSKNDFWPLILLVGNEDSLVYNKIQNSISQKLNFPYFTTINFGMLYEDKQIFIANYTNIRGTQINGYQMLGQIFPQNQTIGLYTQNLCLFAQQQDNLIYCIFRNWIEYQEMNLTNDYHLQKQFRQIDFNCHYFNNIYYVKSYQNHKLLIKQDNVIGQISIQDQSTTTKCYFFKNNVINFDYEIETERLALVFFQSITYHIYEIQLDFQIIEQNDNQLFIIKNFILFSYKLLLQIYTKTLVLFKELTFENKFLIIAEQDKDGFYLAQNTNIIKVSINNKRQIKINSSIFQNGQQKQEVTLIQQAAEQDCDFEIQFQKYNNNQRKKIINLSQQQNFISLNEKDYLLNECKNLNGKRVSKHVIHLLSKLEPNPLYFRSIRMQETTLIIYLNRDRLLQIYNCNPTCVQNYQNTVIFDTVPLVDASQQGSNIYITLRFQNQCLFLKFRINVQEVVYEETFLFKNEINYIAILKDNIYFLDGKEIWKLSLNNVDSGCQVMDDFKNIDQIFYSSFTDDYLFIVEQKTLKIFQIIKPLKTFKVIFELQFRDVIQIKIVTFEHYFVIIGRMENAELICQIFNMQNDFHIYKQGTINLDYFKTINFDKIQSVQETNMLYVFGVLYENQQEIVLGYRIDTIISKSPQFIIKLQQQNQMIVFESYSITSKLQEKFLLFLFYSNRKEKQTFLSQKSVCSLEIQSIYDILPKLEMEEENIIYDENSDNQIQFPTTFVLTSAIEELFIYGIYKLYGQKKFRVDESYQV